MKDVSANAHNFEMNIPAIGEYTMYALLENQVTIMLQSIVRFDDCAPEIGDLKTSGLELRDGEECLEVPVAGFSTMLLNF